MTTFQFQQARGAYESGGLEGSRKSIAQMQQVFKADHYLTDGQGKDLLTGADFGGLFEQARNSRPAIVPGGRMAITRVSNDGKYRFLIEVDPPFNSFTFVPYFDSILIAHPLRRLNHAVERFGTATSVRGPP